MQLQENAVKQVYKHREQKRLRRMLHNLEELQAFREGSTFHASPDIFDDAQNIQIGTECMQYWIDTTPSIDDAYKRYRGRTNGIYYRKIGICAAKLKSTPDSMQPLREMTK